MKKILVAVDFSNHTTDSCNFAFNLAKLYKAEIMLFHTFNKHYYFSSPGIPDTFEVNPFPNAEYSSDNEANTIQQMETLQNELIEKGKTQSFSLKISTTITNGNFEGDLIDFCEDYFPSVVIVGSKGKDENSSLFGNTAIRIFNKLKFPVIAVPKISETKIISNILYIADLETPNNVLIRKTFNLLEDNNPKIYCVHLAEDSNYLKAYSSKEYLNSEYINEVNENKFQCEVLEGTDKQEEIDVFIREKQIDLIVFMPHKTNFFQRLIGQNNSKKYLFETNLPILAIRM